MNKLNNKGFTLIEILAVIAILSILTFVAVPNVISFIESGRANTYDIMVNDIKIASESLFEELENNNSILYVYTRALGKTTNKITLTESGNTKTIEVNLQSLVSNGFLTGSKPQDGNTNKNSKALINPKNNEDLGDCTIIITRNRSDTYQITYSVASKAGNSASCPTTADFNKN